VQTTVSNRSSTNGKCWASASRRVTSIPSSAAPVAGQSEHGQAEVDPGQLDSSRIEGQVPAGTDCDLQYLTGRL
jgi:hypothetical protein